MKKYFITQIPLYIYKNNIMYLSGNRESRISFDEEESKCVRASIVRSRRKEQADQVQLSLTSIDDQDFVAFRRLLHVGDYLVLLKHKEKLSYDCIGVKAKDETRGGYHLLTLNNRFYKLSTNTKVDIQKLIEIKDVEEVPNHDKTLGAGQGSGVRKTGAENILFYGVPGAGKSHEIKTKYCTDEQRMERVVFHPDYMYTDFVGQILPRVERDGEGNDKLKYVFSPGPFTKMLKKAENDPDNYYYLVIEELNRGNAPAIFGETFQLLDRKDEDEFPKEEIGESEYSISNYEVAKEVYGKEDHSVRIPSNMYILATMNTADQNVFAMDTAFQRRWNMKRIENKFDESEHSKDIIAGTKVNWGAFATVINDMIIEINIDMINTEDKRLGIYFAKKKELEVNIFPEKVLKYLWDDAFKMDRTAIFNENCKSLDDVIAAYKDSQSDKLEAVLKAGVYEKMLSKMQQNKESQVVAFEGN
ncbi:MAG: AAA family ATPase [Muribaculaceae bacterium]|nr:AAA family ATPase [Muribaculaceae bacterium]